MPNKKAKEVMTSFQSMVGDRTLLDTEWRDAFDYTYPLRAQGFNNRNFQDGDVKSQTARDKKALIFDSTGTDSSKILASSTLSGLIPSGSNWFTLTLPEIDTEEVAMDFTARRWLDDTSQVVQKKIDASNFDSMAFEVMLDTVIAGYAALFVTMKNGELVFEHVSPDTMYIADTLGRGRIDTIYRTLCMTAQSMAVEFGFKNLPQTLQNHLKTNPNDPKKHFIVHCVRPRLRNGKQTQGRMAKTMPWESVWVHHGTGEVLREGGFEEFPYIVPRWSRIPNTNYAMGAVHEVLPDIKTVNQIAEFILIHSETVIAPPIVVKDDGVVNPATVKFAPRYKIVVEDTENLKALNLGGEFRVGEQQMVRLQRQIRRGLMTDELSPSQESGTPATATEIRARTRRIRQILGPVFGRMQREFLAPLVERVFNLLNRADMIPTAPSEITQQQIVPVFQNPLSRASRQDDIDAMDQLEAHIAAVAGAKPDVLDNYDSDKAVQLRADILGVPTEIIKSPVEVQRARRERAALVQQQQALALEQGGGGDQ